MTTTEKPSSIGPGLLLNDVSDGRKNYSGGVEDSDEMKKFEAAIAGSKIGLEKSAEQILHTFSVPVVYASDLSSVASSVCVGGDPGCASNSDSSNFQSSDSINFGLIDPRLVNDLKFWRVCKIIIPSISM